MRLSFPNGEHPDVALADGELSLGSGGGNKVVLAMEGVLPRHASIRIEPQRGILLNVAAAGADVHVNGRAVKEVALLRLGDVLSIGRVQILLKPDSDNVIKLAVPQPTPAAPVPIDSPQRAAAARVVVRGVAGAFHGRSITLQDAVLIGRDPAAGIRIDDPEIPDKVATLEINGDHVLLRDLGSPDGAVVNGVPVRDAVLHPGDQIAFDVHRFVLEAPGLPPRGNELSLAPTPGAHMGTTQTMRAVRAEAPAAPAAKPEYVPEPASPSRRWMWLLAAALAIAGALASLILYGPS